MAYTRGQALYEAPAQEGDGLMAKRVLEDELAEFVSSSEACRMLGLREERGPKYLMLARYMANVRYIRFGEKRRYSYYWHRDDILRARRDRIFTLLGGEW